MNNQTSKPTVVLVHGAFEDGSIWKGVLHRLRREGFPVVIFANPLRGVGIDAAHLRSTLDQIEGSVILAAHSYGGAVITQAGGDRKVKALVYAGSILPDVGEAPAVLIERFPGSSFLTATYPVDYVLPDGTRGTQMFYHAEQFHSQTAADVPEEEGTMMAYTQRPMDVACLMEAPTQAAWKVKPTWQILTTQDRAIPLEEQRFEAERARSTAIEVQASHAVTVSQSDVVADVILRAHQQIVEG